MKTTRIPHFLALVRLTWMLLMMGAGSGARGELTSHSLQSGCRERQFLLAVPTAVDTGSPMPLVFVLHGGGGTAAGTASLDGGRFQALSGRDGFLLVYPQGVDNGWNDGRGDNKVTAQSENIDDVQFFADMIDAISRQYMVDSRRIYACGISNGGFMSLRLAQDLSRRFAAVTAVTANVSAALAKSSPPAAPVSVMFINGTQDPLVPYHGGQVMVFGKERGEVLSSHQSAMYWALADGCRPIAARAWAADLDPADGCRVITSTWSGGREGTEVVLESVVGGGHTWPGGSQYLPRVVIGTVCRDFNASDRIWSFFSAHARR